MGSTQGTNAQARVAGNGGVIVGAVSGNYTAVETTAAGKGSPMGSYTDTTATQTNIGGTLAGGLALNKNARPGPGSPLTQAVSVQGNGASGSAGGGQSSMAGGTAAASATNINLGGFIKVETPRGHGSTR